MCTWVGLGGFGQTQARRNIETPLTIILLTFISKILLEFLLQVCSLNKSGVMFYYWRASEASETLSGLFNRESRYVYNIRLGGVFVVCEECYNLG